MGSYKANNNSGNNSNNSNSTEQALQAGAQVALKATPVGRTIDGIRKVPGVGKVVDNRINKTIHNVSNVLPNNQPKNKLENNNINNNASNDLDDNVDVESKKENKKKKNISSIFGNNKSKSKSSFDGDITKFIGKSFKIKLIVACSIVFVFIMMVFAVFAQDDLHNLDLMNGTDESNSSAIMSKDEIEKNIVEISVDDLSSLEVDENGIYVINLENNTEDINTTIDNIKNILTEKDIVNYYILDNKNDTDLLISSFPDKVYNSTSDIVDEIYKKNNYNNVDVGSLKKGLEEVAQWYINNVKTYSSGKSFTSPYPTSKARADCTGFVAVYMSSVSGQAIPIGSSASMTDPNGKWAKSVESAGWKAISSDDVGELMYGDVLVCKSGVLYSTKGHHAEVYIDESHTFGWGSKKTKFPTNNTIKRTERNGHVHFEDKGHDYITIYRYVG